MFNWLCFGAATVLAVLKLAGLSAISWSTVFLPIYLWLGIIVIFIVIYGLIALAEGKKNEF